MIPAPDVSVIVPVYNGADTLERALGSVADQTLGLARIQVLVVDDGSTDASPAILDRMAAERPSFEVFHQPNSGGPAAPRNFALGRVRGRYIFFLDQDDYLSPDALEAMVRIADENGTDVVVPRMKGVGGRSVPRVMFTRTVPRTDVFASSVYWTLIPSKLFRTEMVRSLRLRFSEDVRMYEDQPFVAMAYLRGGGASILADKDYVFWVNREDGSNITSNRVSLADRMLGAGRMFDMVAEHVPPGPKRDALIRRHFEIELLGYLFLAYRLERDPAVREAAFERFREISAAYYNQSIDEAFLARGRVLMRLLSEGRPERFAAYLDALAETPNPVPVLVEGERVFLVLPWFRDPAEELPDDLFDVAPKLRAYCRVDPVEVRSDGIRVRAICRLGELTEHITDVSLVLRSRTGSGEAAFPLAFEFVSEEGNAFVEVDDTVPAEGLLAAAKGDIRDLHMRVAAGDVWRERRVTECAPRPSKRRILRGPGGTGRAGYGILTTSPKGYLTLRVLDRLGLVAYLLRRLRRTAARAVRRRLGRTRA